MCADTRTRYMKRRKHSRGKNWLGNGKRKLSKVMVIFYILILCRCVHLIVHTHKNSLEMHALLLYINYTSIKLNKYLYQAAIMITEKRLQSEEILNGRCGQAELLEKTKPNKHKTPKMQWFRKDRGLFLSHVSVQAGSASWGHPRSQASHHRSSVILC